MTTNPNLEPLYLQDPAGFIGPKTFTESLIDSDESDDAWFDTLERVDPVEFEERMARLPPAHLALQYDETRAPMNILPGEMEP